MKLKDIDRTATVAWGPHQSQTYLATGTMSGALDASFSNKSDLELFKLDFTEDSIAETWKPKAVLNSNARFNRIAWGAIAADKPHGIIAGGMENGELALWNAASILDDSNSEDALIMSNTSHTGSVRGLDFNPFQQNLLASAAGNGEIFIWDLTNPTKPYSPGPRSQRLDDITSLSWNNQVQHILATSSTTGYTVVWDLKNRREVMHMAYPGASMGMGGRGGITAVAWNPDNATQLVTASEDDHNPVIMMWDLRNAHAPEKILSGHSKGILSLSWCKMDSDLLLSTGKDCRTLCWNPRVGEVVGELPSSANWTFDVQWCPKNPNLLSTASFDGKVNVFSLQSGVDDNNTAEPSPSQAQNDDPFNAQNYTNTTNSSFSLKQAPKWLRPPVGGTFSFGGKLVSFGNNSQTNSPNTTVSISTVVTEPEIVKRSQELEAALESNNLQEFCEARANSTTDKDGLDSWRILRILFESDARDRLISHLGFKKDELVAQIAEKMSKLEVDEKKAPEGEESSAALDTEIPTEESANEESSPKSENVSELFSDSDDKDSLDFFVQQPEQAESPAEEAMGSVSKQNQLVSLPRLPFKFNPDENSDVDRLITRSITLGDFESAVNLCLKSDRLSDALVLAICGGGDLLVRTQQAYFEQKSQSTPYIRILRSVISGDLDDIVENADIGEWDEILAILCTYSSSENFADLCEKLGSRLEAEWHKTAGRGDVSVTDDVRHHATVCYLASGNISKVLGIWLAQESEAEAAALASHSDSRGQILQDFMEKLAVLQKAIDQNETPVGSERDMSQLYRRYLDYAEILITQGQLATAVKYLSYVPSEVQEGEMNEAEKCSIIKDRIYNSGIGADILSPPVFPFEFVPVGLEGQPPQSQPEPSVYQESSQQGAAIPNNSYPTASQPQQYYNQYDTQTGYQQEAQASSYPAVNTYPTQVQQNYYTPSGASPYGGYQQPSVPEYNVPNTFGNTNYAAQTPSAPPVAPPSQLRNTPAWNDPPMASVAAAKQRAPTPKVAPITSPFPNAVSTPSSPNAGYAAPPMGKPMPPPPRPGSGLGANSQAGSPNANAIPKVPQPNTQFIPNSYSGVTPNNTTPMPNYGAGYAASNSPVNQYQQGIQRGPSPMIPQPPNTLPSTTSQLAGKPVSKPSSPAPKEPAAPKYPPGDRSHIPSAHIPIYQKLSGEFQRVRQGALPNQRRMLDDVEKRLNLLFDALNLETLPQDITDRMLTLTQALEKHDFHTAQQIHLDLVTTKFAIVGQWMVGVKRLIELVRSHSGM
ncbi:WD40 repeat-like protein [Basidiobolus meristosporus CBS 931.73]|uniref:Protein transport protein SEC31 n=1 Tax=Basidiobolus meristosporus CBS 931.73 TaxID=1314790 RepID=A0A1Y1XC66_9FUNG|nr:WD40 repeat-like protein [Basidiobolus meristosporus CBS 931.73]|eukprot:ORX82954.1 WD40 repeat-like protein [Basidiobolus meristosporus CBS 931.73]